MKTINGYPMYGASGFIGDIDNYKQEKFHLDSIEKQENIINIPNKCCRMIKLRKKKQLQEYDSLIKDRFIESFGNPEINDMYLDVHKLSDKLSVIGEYAFKSDSFQDDALS